MRIDAGIGDELHAGTCGLHPFEDIELGV